LPDEHVHAIVTSQPYWRQARLRRRLADALEATPEQYVADMVAVFAEAHRVLRPDGTRWINIGDKWASGGNGSGWADKNAAAHALEGTPRGRHALGEALPTKDATSSAPWPGAAANRTSAGSSKQSIRMKGYDTRNLRTPVTARLRTKATATRVTIPTKYPI
jgi:hypothetical protein